MLIVGQAIAFKPGPNLGLTSTLHSIWAPVPGIRVAVTPGGERASSTWAVLGEVLAGALGMTGHRVEGAQFRVRRFMRSRTRVQEDGRIRRTSRLVNDAARGWKRICF